MKMKKTTGSKDYFLCNDDDNDYDDGSDTIMKYSFATTEKHKNKQVLFTSMMMMMFVSILTTTTCHAFIGKQSISRSCHGVSPICNHYERKNDGRIIPTLFTKNPSDSSSRLYESVSKKQKQKWLRLAKATNQEILQMTTASDLLGLFITKGGAKGIAGGGALNSVNYSTCFHRLARFSSTYDNHNHHNNNNNKRQAPKKQLTTDQKRKLILSDPRFAILMASLAEALAQSKSDDRLQFNSRELSNIAWAIAKLRVTPPSKTFPLTTNKNDDDDGEELLELANKVRTQVLEVAKERATLASPEERAAVKNKWIPTTSQLSARVLDWIASNLSTETTILEKNKNNENRNPQELANLLWAFATAQRADEHVFDVLIHDLLHVGPQKPQELSNSVWAFASSGIRTKGQVQLVRYIADTFTDSQTGADHNEKNKRNQHHQSKLGYNQYKPQELSNTAWGIATLLSKRRNISLQQHSQNAQQIDKKEDSTEDEAAVVIFRKIAAQLSERVDEFKPQEISNTIWAFATVGFGAADSAQSNSYNDYFYVSGSDKTMDVPLIQNTLQIVAANIITKLHRFRPQELNNLAWGMARLGHYDSHPLIPKLCQGIGQEIIKRYHKFSPQDIGTSLWAFATVGYLDDQEVFYKAASRLSYSQARTFKPQEMSNTVWALATAGITPQFTHAFDNTLVSRSHQRKNSLEEITRDPITECFAAAASEIIRRPHEFKEQEIKDILWSFSKVGIRHPLLFRTVAEHLVGGSTSDNSNNTGRGLKGFSPQGLGNLAWSFAKQAQLADVINDDMKSIGSNGRLAIYETSCLDVGESRINLFFSRIAEAGLEYHDELRSFKPQDLSNTAWAFATLGMIHQKFFAATAHEFKQRYVCDEAKDIMFENFR